MIRLIVYLGGAYWALKQLGFQITKAKPVQGYGEVHDPFEHPLGDHVCQVCEHHHPELEQRVKKLEKFHG